MYVLSIIEKITQNFSLRHEAEFLVSMFNHLRLEVSPAGILASNLERTWYMVKFLIRANSFKAGAFHMFTPNSHPVIGLCKSDMKSFAILKSNQNTFQEPESRTN